MNATKCPGRGRLADSSACRETVVEALAERDVALVSVRTDDNERVYGRDGTAFLLAAGRFAAYCEDHDATLATLARRDPFAGARIAAGRPDPIARVAAETAFVEGASVLEGYERAFGIRSSGADSGPDPSDDAGDGE